MSDSTSATLSEEIDRLLEHYLSLLDQYTTLWSELSSLQSSVYQNISRANFSAERGVRYGADFYDVRMRATRVCRITDPAEDPSPTTTGALAQQDAVESDSLEDLERDAAAEGARSRQEEAVGTARFAVVRNNGPPACLADGQAAGGEVEIGAGKAKVRDPLRMFGLLTPSALKEAQKGSVTLVEDILPRLVEVDTEMKEVEIRIRRGRKWRAKAEARELADQRRESLQRVEVVV